MSVVVVMGVSGSGKSTLSAQLAAALNAELLEADDYHSPEAVATMRAGKPLSDDIRLPWIESICQQLANTDSKTIVVACSALRRFHRQKLRHRAAPIQFLYLHGNRPLLASRLGQREDHFMPASLLTSQLQTLDWPADEADVTWLDIRKTPAQILAHAIEALTW